MRENYIQQKDHPRILPGRPPLRGTKAVRFLNYWLSLAGDGETPARSSIDPLHIAECLPFVWIYQKLEGEEAYRCLLSGEEINDIWNGSIRGKRTDELFSPENNRKVLHRWDTIRNNRVVGYSYFEAHCMMERIVAPLTDRDGNPSLVFGATVPVEHHGTFRYTTLPFPEEFTFYALFSDESAPQLRNPDCEIQETRD